MSFLRSYKFFSFFLGLFLCASLLISCQSQSLSSSQQYLYSDSTHIAFLSWVQDQGHITHGELQMDRQMSSRGSISPYHNTNTIDGEAKGSTVTLKVAGGLVTMTGKEDGERLVLENVPMADGTLQTQTWWIGTQAQYQELQEAFDANIRVSSALGTLQGHLGNIPPDSDPSTLRFGSVAVQNDLASLAVGVEEVKTAKSEPSLCSAYVLDVQPYLLDASAFQVPDPAKSTIAQDIAEVEKQFHEAQALPVPQVKGLTYPWQLQAPEVAKRLQPGRDALSAYDVAARQEQIRLRAIHEQYDQILRGIDLNSLRASCSRI